MSVLVYILCWKDNKTRGVCLVGLNIPPSLFLDCLTATSAEVAVRQKFVPFLSTLLKQWQPCHVPDLYVHHVVRTCNKERRRVV